jgi:hypothetical protein
MLATSSIQHPITILRKPIIDDEKRSSTSATSFEDQIVVAVPIQDAVAMSSTDEQVITLPIEGSGDIEFSNDSTATPLNSNEPCLPSDTSSSTITSVGASERVSTPKLTLEFPAYELLSILQSHNSIAAFNEYAQRKKFTLDYAYSLLSLSSTFTCTVSINNEAFPASSPYVSKLLAQHAACNDTLRTLYRQSCTHEQPSMSSVFSKHDFIAHRSLSTFHELKINELVSGRKNLACMLLVINNEFDQARVISMAIGSSCLDESNLARNNTGTALHDCHAEILARRGLIRFLFEQIKQARNDSSSIFEYHSPTNKYRLQENITFHMYISSLPCGNASLTKSPSYIRYKQGQMEGTLLASTSSLIYPIKSCSDKICRWNVLGIQGGLIINLLDKPIYLTTITLPFAAASDRQHIEHSLSTCLKDHCHSLPSSYTVNLPEIDCPQVKHFQRERQVAKLQTCTFAWNMTQSEKIELLEPRTGRLK